MGFFDKLFGKSRQGVNTTETPRQPNESNTEEGNSESAADKGQNKQGKQADRQADTLKFDAIRAMKLGELGFALSALEKSLELRDEFEARYYYVEALLMASRQDEALSQMDLLLDEEPNHLPTLLGRSQLLLHLNRYSDSMADADKGIELQTATEQEKDDLNLYQLSILKAKALRGLERTSEAIELLAKTAQQHEEIGQTHLLKAEMEIAIGRKEDATDSLLQAGALLPEEERVPLLLAQIAESDNVIDKAFKLYQDALDLNPFCVEALCAKANLRYKQGEWEQAIAMLTEAKEGMAPSKELLLTLIDLHTKLGQTTEAEALRSELKENETGSSTTKKNSFDNLYSGGIY
ncbi:MAG: tetratricopeptide repeat protein [Porphyromonas sp.]|nr:tetratricopeptide repeat protein [Porphyromonas sp.]